MPRNNIEKQNYCQLEIKNQHQKFDAGLKEIKMKKSYLFSIIFFVAENVFPSTPVASIL